MAKGLLGKKLGMTQVFSDRGELIPVTVIQAGPCVVVQKKTEETDGYSAIQLGFDDQSERRTNRPMRGHFKRAGVSPKKVVREIRTQSVDDYEVGQVLKADLFAPGDVVDITGTSKGKGFAGVIKRHNFGRGPMSHGSKYHRRTGSLGATDPARVFKGRKMPGRMGGDTVTISGLEIVRVDAERDLILVKGAVPGPRGGHVLVKSSVKAKAN
ncbi:MAG: 50S ribosomal protein L3 [Bacillota bacterium]